MPKKIQSRISKSKANKKIMAPRWIIFVVLMIVAGTGAFLVYNSFAAGYPKLPYSTYSLTLYCKEGRCYTYNPGGGIAQTKSIQRSVYCSSGLQWSQSGGKRYGWVCVNP